jgi:hypothetical protein
MASPSGTSLDVDLEVDALYALPVGEFTAARDALIKRLRAVGARPEAERVKSLRKPSPVAAAVNQLAREAAADVAALRAAGDAQRGLVANQAPATAQRAAREEVARRAAELVARAIDDLGLAASLGQRLRLTLEALAAWGSTAQSPPVGRLTDEVAPPGFEVLADLAPAVVDGEADGPRRLGRPAPVDTVAPPASPAAVPPVSGPPAAPEVDLAAQGRREAHRRAAAVLATAEAEAVQRAEQVASAERALMTAADEVADAVSRVAALEDAMRRLASELAAAEGAVAELSARRGVVGATVAAAREASLCAGRAVERARAALSALAEGPLMGDVAASTGRVVPPA